MVLFYTYFAKQISHSCILFLVVYPIIHFTEDRSLLMSVLQDQKELNEHFKLHQGINTVININNNI